MDRLEEINAFAAVADARNCARRARRLGVSAPHLAPKGCAIADVLAARRSGQPEWHKASA